MKQFNLVQAQKPKRSAFDLSHERKLTLNMGELIPVMCTEVLPGDRFKVDFESFLRMMPMISPVMHRVNLYVHAFFVPNRLLLDNNEWEKYITQQTGAMSTLPYFAEDAFNGGYQPVPGDLLDHLGYGVKCNARSLNATLSQMPIRAYHKIWNDHYRDQNLQTEYDIIGLPSALTIGHASIQTFVTVRKRAWEKDYFTSSLTSQQRGNVVTVPLGTYAPVQGKYKRTGNVNDTLVFKKTDGGATGNGAIALNGNVLRDINTANISVDSGLEADLTNATGGSITALRRAFALQRWYEASMRFGQRYVEQLLGLFGVVSKDARLQRAEFLAGGKIPVQIGEVLQTSATAAGQTVQGNMAGRGLGAGVVTSFDRTFDEHGYIMCIMSVMPRTSYQTLALRQNFKLDVFDFAFPQLAHLSEQPVYVGEVWNRAANATSRAAFGYQPQYSEYRYIPDSVHGQFKDTLAFWGLQRDFAAQPALNEAFVTCSPRTDIFPVAFANNQLIAQTYAKIIAFRPLPKFGTPV